MAEYRQSSGGPQGSSAAPDVLSESTDLDALFAALLGEEPESLTTPRTSLEPVAASEDPSSAAVTQSPPAQDDSLFTYDEVGPRYDPLGARYEPPAAHNELVSRPTARATFTGVPVVGSWATFPSESPSETALPKPGDSSVDPGCESFPDLAALRDRLHTPLETAPRITGVVAAPSGMNAARQVRRPASAPPLREKGGDDNIVGKAWDVVDDLGTPAKSRLDTALLKTWDSRRLWLILVGVTVVVSGAIITLKAIPRVAKTVEQPTVASVGGPDNALRPASGVPASISRSAVDAAPLPTAIPSPRPGASTTLERAPDARAAQPSNRRVPKSNDAKAASRPRSGRPIDLAEQNPSPAAETEQAPASTVHPAPGSVMDAGGTNTPVTAGVAPLTDVAPRAPTPEPMAPLATSEKPRAEPPLAPNALEPPKSPSATLSRTPPRLLKGSTPEYPNVLRSARVTGTVDVQVTLDETGRVTEATATSGPGPLRSLAERAVRTWLYEPATTNGVRTASKTTVTFRFSEK